MCVCVCACVCVYMCHTLSWHPQITKRASESSALQHITASRPRPVGRRKPRKYLTYDEDDVSVHVSVCGVCV